MKNKKAVSQIISVVFLIFIIIVLAGIILSFSKGFIKKQRERAGGFPFYYGAQLHVLTGSAISEPMKPLENLQLAVRRLDNQENVTGVRFIFEDNLGNTYSYDVYENLPNNAGIAEVYEINAEDSGIDDFSTIQKVSVRFLYGNKKATGILDEAEIK